LQQKIKLKGYYDLYQQIARKGTGFLHVKEKIDALIKNNETPAVLNNFPCNISESF